MSEPVHRVTFISHKGTLQVVNTLHVVETGPGPYTQSSQDVADAVNTDLQAAYRALLGTTYTLDEITAVQVPAVYGSGVVPAAGSHPLGIAGTRTLGDSHVPDRVCSMIQWLTGTYGRRARGRFYAPPLESTVTFSNDFIGSGTQYGGALTAFAADVVDQGLPGTLKYCVYSPTQHRENATPYWFEITGSKVSLRVAFLSSRDQ